MSDAAMLQAAMEAKVGAPAPSAAARSPRLNPRRFSGRYYVLTQLRREMEVIIAAHIPDRPGTLIDFGCGDSPYRPLMPQQVRYIAADLSSNPAASVHLEGEGRVPLPDGSAEYVLSSQVLEHVTDPPAYLAEARRLLSHDGLLILSTHGVWKYHPHPRDLWRWTGEGLRQTVTTAGFTIERFTGLLGMAAAGVLLLQDGLVMRTPRRLRSLVAGAMQPLIHAADLLHDDAQRRQDAAVFCLVARSTHRAEKPA